MKMRNLQFARQPQLIKRHGFLKLLNVGLAMMRQLRFGRLIMRKPQFTRIPTTEVPLANEATSVFNAA